MQVVLAYRLESNAEVSERMEDSETHVAGVVANWAEKHGIKH